jgi:hypothetical protein
MTALVALCAAVLTATGARSAASVVPARIDAALLLDGAQAAPGLRPFLDGVAQRAPALSPASYLAAAVGPDLVGDPASWGLARTGPRAVVMANGAFALTAPVRDSKAARAALDAWLRQAGPVRSRSVAGHTAFWSGDGRRVRIGFVASVAGSVRLVTASGADAAALAGALAQIGAKNAAAPPLSGDRVFRDALAQLTAPAALVLRGSGPLRGAALRLAGSADGLVATGLVLAPGPLVLSNAPDASACADGALFCLRASLGPAGREALALAARTYLSAVLAAQEMEAFSRVAARGAAVAEQLVVRSDGADARLLTDSATPWPALQLWAASSPSLDGANADAEGARPSCIRSDPTRTWFAMPCLETVPADLVPKQAEPALDATLNLAAIDAVLHKLTPLDVVHGGMAAALYAGRLTAGGLLRRSGPVRLRGTAHPAGAQVELRWPLH